MQSICMFPIYVQAARARGVDCIVAPYEADAQLAYLNKTGMVQAIITEDSDLLAFGCKKVGKKILIAFTPHRYLATTNSAFMFAVCIYSSTVKGGNRRYDNSTQSLFPASGTNLAYLGINYCFHFPGVSEN